MTNCIVEINFLRQPSGVASSRASVNAIPPTRSSLPGGATLTPGMHRFYSQLFKIIILILKSATFSKLIVCFFFVNYEGGPPSHRSPYGQSRTGTNLTITPSVTITPTNVPPRKDVMVRLRHHVNVIVSYIHLFIYFANSANQFIGQCIEIESSEQFCFNYSSSSA